MGRRFGVLAHAHRPVFQGGGCPEDALGAGRVLDTRELHDDAIGSLLLHQRLGHAQFVDPVAQRRDVLLQRGVGNFPHLGIGNAVTDVESLRSLEFLTDQLRQILEYAA